MKRITVLADAAEERHAVLRCIERRWGAEARLVVQEFVANALEHCEDHRVDLSFGERALMALDHGGGFRSTRSTKSEGEGGLGLILIRAFGGRITSWSEGLRLDYRFPDREGSSHERLSCEEPPGGNMG